MTHHDMVRGDAGALDVLIRILAPAALLGCAAIAGPVQGQALVPPEPEAAVTFLEPPLGVDGRYVVIRLEENHLYLVEGRTVLWDAPVATGTGFRLETGGQEWEFDTPRGVFRVERKEKDPVWIMPDWAFHERGEPVPPPDSPLRRVPGTLGSAAIYIGYELAIHGTDRPELVLNPDPEARRISHGCIRMTDESARRLFHDVDVGTLVLIY